MSENKVTEDTIEENTIEESTNKLITFMCNVLEKTEECRKCIQKIYEDYLSTLRQDGPKISFEEFQRVDEMYNKFHKLLTKFSKAIIRDYLDLLNVALKIFEYRSQYELALKELDQMELDPEDRSYFKAAGNLEKKMKRIEQKYDELVAVYNTRINNLSTFDKYLENNLIIYFSNDDRKFVIPVKDYVKEFASLNTDDSYKEKGMIITQYLEEMVQKLADKKNSPLIPIKKLRDREFDGGLKTEVKQEVKMEPKDEPEVKLEPKDEPEVKLEPKGEPEVKLEPKGEPEVKMEPKVEPEVKLEPKVEPQVKLTPKVYDQGLLNQKVGEDFEPDKEDFRPGLEQNTLPTASRSKRSVGSERVDSYKDSRFQVAERVKDKMRDKAEEDRKGKREDILSSRRNIDDSTEKDKPKVEPEVKVNKKLKPQLDEATIYALLDAYDKELNSRNQDDSEPQSLASELEEIDGTYQPFQGTIYENIEDWDNSSRDEAYQDFKPDEEDFRPGVDKNAVEQNRSPPASKSKPLVGSERVDSYKDSRFQVAERVKDKMRDKAEEDRKGKREDILSSRRNIDDSTEKDKPKVEPEVKVNIKLKPQSDDAMAYPILDANDKEINFGNQDDTEPPSLASELEEIDGTYQPFQGTIYENIEDWDNSSRDEAYQDLLRRELEDFEPDEDDSFKDSRFQVAERVKDEMRDEAEENRKGKRKDIASSHRNIEDSTEEDGTDPTVSDSKPQISVKKDLFKDPKLGSEESRSMEATPSVEDKKPINVQPEEPYKAVLDSIQEKQKQKEYQRELKMKKEIENQRNEGEPGIVPTGSKEDSADAVTAPDALDERIQKLDEPKSTDRDMKSELPSEVHLPPDSDTEERIENRERDSQIDSDSGSEASKSVEATAPAEQSQDSDSSASKNESSTKLRSRRKRQVPIHRTIETRSMTSPRRSASGDFRKLFKKVVKKIGRQSAVDKKFCLRNSKNPQCKLALLISDRLSYKDATWDSLVEIRKQVKFRRELKMKNKALIEQKNEGEPKVVPSSKEDPANAVTVPDVPDERIQGSDELLPDSDTEKRVENRERDSRIDSESGSKASKSVEATASAEQLQDSDSSASKKGTPEESKMKLRPRRDRQGPIPRRIQTRSVTGSKRPASGDTKKPSPSVSTDRKTCRKATMDSLAEMKKRAKVRVELNRKKLAEQKKEEIMPTSSQDFANVVSAPEKKTQEKCSMKLRRKGSLDKDDDEAPTGTEIRLRPRGASTSSSSTSSPTAPKRAKKALTDKSICLIKSKNPQCKRELLISDRVSYKDATRDSLVEIRKQVKFLRELKMKNKALIEQKNEEREREIVPTSSQDFANVVSAPEKKTQEKSSMKLRRKRPLDKDDDEAPTGTEIRLRPRKASTSSSSTSSSTAPKRAKKALTDKSICLIKSKSPQCNLAHGLADSASSKAASTTSSKELPDTKSRSKKKKIVDSDPEAKGGPF